MENIGRNIKHFRAMRGLSRGELAKKIGMSVTAIYVWEEKGLLPKKTVLPKLADAMDVSIEDLLNPNASNVNVEDVNRFSADKATINDILKRAASEIGVIGGPSGRLRVSIEYIVQ